MSISKLTGNPVSMQRDNLQWTPISSRISNKTIRCHLPSLFNPLIPMSNKDFSLQYQYNIRQISDGNEEKYQLGDS